MQNWEFNVAAEVQQIWNRPLYQQRIWAHQGVRLGNYHYINDMWFPKNLRQGDVIQAFLPTQYDHRFDQMELWPRNCLVLGIDVNRETAEPEFLKVMRFSYNTADVNEHEFFFDPEDYRFKIHGFRKRAVLRTGRIETIPFDAGSLNYYVNMTGWLDPEVMDIFDAAIDKGYTYKRSGRDLPYDQNSETVCVPSLNPLYYTQDSKQFDIVDDSFGPTIDDIDHEEWEFIKDRMEANYVVRELKRPDILKHEKEEVRDEVRAVRWMRREKRSLINRLTLGGHKPKKDSSVITHETIETVLKQHMMDEREMIPERDDMWGDEAMVLRRSDITPLKEILYKRFGLKMETQTLDLSDVFKQRIDPQSIADLQTFGIGGFVRASDVSIPEHLWQGRYVMARIADLSDPENYNNAYRPCVITKAYAKMNEDGEPVLAGLEMHPCTRKQAGDFAFKMPVYPFGYITDAKANKQQSFVIAEMIVRLPLTAENFQSHLVQNSFHELSPQMVDRIIRRAEYAKEARGGDLQIFGLKDIPHDWVEIKLPSAPMPEIQSKLTKWGKARFIPS